MNAESGNVFHPLADRLFVRIPDAADRLSKGGIHIPVTANKIILRGEVVAVGPEVEVLRPGDQVLVVRVLGVDASNRPELDDLPTLQGIKILREHEITAASGPGIKERSEAAYAKGARVGWKEGAPHGR